MTDAHDGGRVPPVMEVDECIPVTKDDENTFSPTPSKSQNAIENRASGDSHRSSEGQDDTLSIIPKESAGDSGGSMQSDKGATHHDSSMLKQAEGVISRTDPWPSTNLQNRHGMVGGTPVRGFVPIPPLPDTIPILPDTLPSGRKVTWVEALEHNASLLDDQGLYRAFQSRRMNQPEMRGPNLLSAIAGYLGAAEERLASLQRYPQDFNDRAPQTQGGRPDWVRETPRHMPTPMNTMDEVLLEISFYNCEDGFAFMKQPPQESSLHAQQAAQGQYTCPYDPNYLIRAQFEWKGPPKGPGEPSRQILAAKDAPDANDIDVLTFMVSSPPLTAFFEQRLGLKLCGSPILKLAKPFRAVIANYRRLEGHLKHLVKKYGCESAEHIDLQDREQRTDSQYVFQENMSTAVSSSEYEYQPYIFDRRSALEHFKLLIQFIDQYLGDKVSLFESFQAGSAETVAFEDLWMLFNNGQKIACPIRESRVTIDLSNSKAELKTVFKDDSTRYHRTRRRHVPQAYRVMAAVGGAPLILSLLEPPTAADTTREDMNDFSEFKFYHANPSVSPALQRARQRLSSLRVSCMYVDFDGAKYGTDMEIFVFKPFDGQVVVNTLEAYPLTYSVKPGSPDLVRRGRKFIDIASLPRHMNYAGMTIGETKEEYNGPTVVDLKLAFTEYQKDFPQDDSITPKFRPLSRFHPVNRTDIAALFDHLYSTSACPDGPYCYKISCGCDRYNGTLVGKLKDVHQSLQELLDRFGTFSRDEEGIERFKKFMEDQDLIELLPGSVPGFLLRNRTWVQLNLDQLDFIGQQDDWNKLALPKGHREIVQAMVETHTFDSKKSDQDSARNRFEMDLVRGKGNGCIILLHGVPGVGKTSTAECVASYTKRPLYSITCGDVGYEPEDVERNMGKHFKLANRWGCVLLLDEADVFLSKRNKTDVKRNGLVSVFLRILEYYYGILFLTTNRVGAIDDAFRSRLHLTLYYPKLTEAQTLKIWKTNFQRLKENNKLHVEGDGFSMAFNDKKITAWVKKHWQEIQWNGRQIRNAFQTAVALAEFEAKQRDKEAGAESSKTTPILTTDHFKKLARVSAQFSKYLRETHGDDEDERAVLEQTRAMPTSRIFETGGFSDEEDESDNMLESESGSDSSGASKSEGGFDSGGESSDEDKKLKKGKKAEGSRSHGSKRDRKGKSREGR